MTIAPLRLVAAVVLPLAMSFMAVAGASGPTVVAADANRVAGAGPSISLIDDRPSSVGLSRPGETAVECVTVVRGGAPGPAAVGMYLDPADLRGTGLVRFIDLVIEVGAAPGTDCRGFEGTVAYAGSLEWFAEAHSDMASAVGWWATEAAGDRATYRISMTLRDDNGAQDLAAAVVFTWGIAGGVSRDDPAK